MSTTMPLFPLGTVLYPGLMLPLHIFEDRYRQLVSDLLDGPEPRDFGVIAIRKGRETGIDGVSALYEVGCMARLRQVRPHDDGRFDLVAVGTQRFRLMGLDHSRPYLRGEIELLAEETGDGAAAALMIVDLGDRQVLLAEPDAAGRLAAERALLARETRILLKLTSAPATGLRGSPYNPN